MAAALKASEMRFLVADGALFGFGGDVWGVGPGTAFGLEAGAAVAGDAFGALVAAGDGAARTADSGIITLYGLGLRCLTSKQVAFGCLPMWKSTPYNDAHL